MHDCEICGQACACDGEDTYFDEQPVDCRHLLKHDREDPESDGADWAEEEEEFLEDESLHTGNISAERGEG